MTEEEKSTFLKALDWIYERSLEKFQTFDSAYAIAEKYLRDNQNDKVASARELIRKESLKAGGIGFVTGLGGFASMPITLPANLASVLYIQIRMIAGVAVIGGHELREENVKVFVLGALLGNELKEVLKNLGIKIGKKIAKNLIKKISSSLLKKINSAVGLKLFTKFGSKGIINLGRLIPVLGGVISGGFDYVSTRQIGEVAIDVFIQEEESNERGA